MDLPATRCRSPSGPLEMPRQTCLYGVIRRYYHGLNRGGRRRFRLMNDHQWALWCGTPGCPTCESTDVAQCFRCERCGGYFPVLGGHVMAEVPILNPSDVI